MANEKIIAQDVFEQSIKDILTLLVNNTYNFTEYTDEEIGNLIDLDPTQIAELTAVISDSVVAKNKVFSSSHTTELIQKSVIESNEYADSLVANLSNIKLDIVDTLPDASTVNKSTIYILKDSTGGTNNTLNVWSDSTSAFVEVGKLNVNMDSYYTKSDVDTLLANKADDNTVVHQDDVVSDMTTTSGTTVLSTSGLKTELDKKANDDEVVKKTDMSTTIDSTSTDDTVPTNKAVYDSLINKVNNTIVLTTTDEVNSFNRTYQSFIIYSDVAAAVGLPNPPNSTWFCIHLSHIKGFKYPSQIAFEYAGLRKIMYRVADNGVWSAWRKIPNTSVADVPVTTITNTLVSTKVTFQAADSNAYLYVKNGICYVSIWDITILEEANLEVLFNNAPKAAFMVGCTLHNGYESFGHIFVTTNSTEIRLNAPSGLAGKSGYCSFSYPVAES